MQKLFCTGAQGKSEVSPCSLMMSTSPGSISRRYSASIRSRAQVSLATTWAPFSSTPRHSGRKPLGSRTAIMVSWVMSNSE